MHFCVSVHLSEWPSQIVLDKVHLRWEIEASRPPGDIAAQKTGLRCSTRVAHFRGFSFTLVTKGPYSPVAS